MAILAACSSRILFAIPLDFMSLAAFLAAVVGHWGGIPFTVISLMPRLSVMGVLTKFTAAMFEVGPEVMIYWSPLF